MNKVISAIAGVGAILAAGSAAAAPFAIASPSCSINTDGWCMGGPEMTGFVGAVTNPSYFGPGGTVSTPVTISSVNTVTAASLAGYGAFASTWWNNAQSASSTAAILNYFHSGGDLVLFDDDSNHDGIAAALGLPTFASNGSDSNGTSPLFVGPFGTATNVHQYAAVGYLSAADVAATHGSIGSVNGLGEITTAYWAAGQYGAGDGKLIIIADVDMVSNAFANPYSPLDSNGIFALNTVNYLISGASVPEPASWAMMILGMGLIGGLARRRTTATAAI